MHYQLHPTMLVHSLMEFIPLLPTDKMSMNIP